MQSMNDDKYTKNKRNQVFLTVDFQKNKRLFFIQNWN